jgi:hypothetical protein
MSAGEMEAQRLLVGMLRFGAVMTGSAFLTLPLSVESMAAVHRWLGLGELPRAPIVEYLARSVSAFYGLHGVLLFMLSTDVERYARLIAMIAVTTVLFGLILLAVDVHAGLPAYWTIGEGPFVALIGVVLLTLNRAASRQREDVVVHRL